VNTYRYSFASACPANDEAIIYALEIQHVEKVLVEHIKTACALHRKGYQEDIAADLHARFGGRLRIVANHHGVEIETVLCEASSPAQAGKEAAGKAPASVPSDAMVDAYLTAQRATVEKADEFGRPNVGGLHTNTVREACRNGLAAALAAQTRSTT